MKQLLRTLHTKICGQKFTGESIIPALDTLIERAAEMGGAICNGNGTCGRLNILANIFGKSTQDIFGELKVKINDIF
jgi:2-oxoglutarate dehydrogenase E1 component